MFSGGAPFGFYNAPVSKALIVITGAASALNILIPALKTRENVQVLNYLQQSNIFHGIWRTLCYSNVKNLLFGSLLLYSFRIFEHRYGSTKYANYLLASTVIGVGVQFTTMYILLKQDITIGEIPAGPFAIIFSLFVPFFMSVPSVAAPNFFGLFPVTGKLFSYVIGLQILLLSRGALVSGISGLIAGVFCHFNICHVQSWLKLPDTVSNLCAKIFGVFFRSSAPASEGRIQGATLEIQRQLRMDELDQQLWRLQEMNVTRRRPAATDNENRRRDGQGYRNVLIGNPGAAVGADTDEGEAVQQPTVEVSEEQVQRLMEMGFTRQAILHALTASNNNMAVAMNLLLAE